MCKVLFTLLHCAIIFYQYFDKVTNRHLNYITFELKNVNSFRRYLIFQFRSFWHRNLMPHFADFNIFIYSSSFERQTRHILSTIFDEFLLECAVRFQVRDLDPQSCAAVLSNVDLPRIVSSQYQYKLPHYLNIYALMLKSYL